MRIKVATSEIKHLRRCYAKDLRTETQASESVRDSMRKIVAILDEVLKARKERQCD